MILNNVDMEQKQARFISSAWPIKVLCAVCVNTQRQQLLKPPV